MTAKGPKRKTQQIDKQDHRRELIAITRWKGWLWEYNTANTRGVYCTENWLRQDHEKDEGRACHIGDKQGHFGTADKKALKWLWSPGHMI